MKEVRGPAYDVTFVKEIHICISSQITSSGSIKSLFLRDGNHRQLNSTVIGYIFWPTASPFHLPALTKQPTIWSLSILHVKMLSQGKTIPPSPPTDGSCEFEGQSQTASSMKSVSILVLHHHFRWTVPRIPWVCFSWNRSLSSSCGMSSDFTCHLQFFSSTSVIYHPSSPSHKLSFWEVCPRCISFTQLTIHTLHTAFLQFSVQHFFVLNIWKWTML